MKQMPKVGDEVYVLGNGDRLLGGLVQVTEVCGEHIIVEAHGGANYRWINGLDCIQDQLRKQYGTQHARALNTLPTA
jgi:hypothetical protein